MDWRDIPSLSALRAFEAAARHQSLSAAGRELNVTHAAVAQHVRALEDRFGTPLLTREGRQMVPSDAGARLATALSEGFLRITDGIRAIQKLSDDRPLTVTLTPSFAENWLMPRIGSFFQEHPNVAVSLQPSERLVDLLRGDVDVAIRYGRGAWSGLAVEFLTAANYVVVATPELLAGAHPNGFGDLQAFPWVLEATRPEAALWAEQNGLDFAQAQVTRFSTNALVLAAARAGLGLSIQGEIMVERDIERGDLVKVLRAGEDALGYYVVSRPGAAHPGLKAFARWLHRSAGNST